MLISKGYHAACLKRMVLFPRIAKYSMTASRCQSIKYNSGPQASSFKHREQREEEKYLEHMRAHERKIKWSKFLSTSLAVIVTTGATLYLWQPWNPYSTEVSKLLRKGLHAEIAKEPNYLKALDYYQQSLKQCTKEGMDHLDQRYTGIVLKVAEMYEKLEMTDKQRAIYTRLSDFLFAKLVNNEVGEEQIDSTIKRDLLVVSRLATLPNTGSPDNIMREMWDRLIFAESRLHSKWPILASKNPQEDLDIFEVLSLNSWADKKQFIAKHMSEESLKFFNQWSPKWPEFLDELITTRDLYATLGMFLNQTEVSIKLLKSNVLLMKLSNSQPVFMGTTLSNLASAYYFKSERHEVNVKKLKDKLSGVEKEDDGLELEMLLQHEESEHKESMQMSETIYKNLIRNLDGNQQNATATSCIAMSLFSLGVINLHRGDYQKAIDYLNQSKEKAMEMDLVQIVDKADNELILLEQEMKK